MTRITISVTLTGRAIAMMMPNTMAVPHDSTFGDCDTDLADVLIDGVGEICGPVLIGERIPYHSFSLTLRRHDELSTRLGSGGGPRRTRQSVSAIACRAPVAVLRTASAGVPR